MSRTKEALPDAIYENFDLFASILDQSVNPDCELVCLECAFSYEHDNSWQGQIIAGTVVIKHYFAKHPANQRDF
jgi:hypothetical protein